VNSPGLYNITFNGKAEICDTKLSYAANNYCEVNAFVTVNALVSSSKNQSDFYFPDREDGGMIAGIVIGSILGFVILATGLFIAIKYRCFCHMCRKKDGAKAGDNKGVYEKTQNEIEIPTDKI
jgi:large-conductance mechanosensitive channel